MGVLTMRIRKTAENAVLLLAAVLCPAGCANVVPAEKYQTVQRELQHANERNRELETTIAAQQQTIRDLGARITALRQLDGDLEQLLIVPERIELARLSGGYDDDGRPGDDGLVLYVQPFDRDQHVVKAAGTLTVKLLDPLNPPNSITYATYEFDLQHTRQLWYGRLMTQHFSVKCPWPQGHLPVHNEIIAHVVFTDLITGKSLTATGAFKINFPPAATMPATPKP